MEYGRSFLYCVHCAKYIYIIILRVSFNIILLKQSNKRPLARYSHYNYSVNIYNYYQNNIQNISYY